MGKWSWCRPAFSVAQAYSAATALELAAQVFDGLLSTTLFPKGLKARHVIARAAGLGKTEYQKVEAP